MNDDRTVHAFSRDKQQLVRYDRGGKWYIEDPNFYAPRRLVTLAEAVEPAIKWWRTGGSPIFDQPGGARFNSAIRKHRDI